MLCSDTLVEERKKKVECFAFYRELLLCALIRKQSHSHFVSGYTLLKVDKTSSLPRLRWFSAETRSLFWWQKWLKVVELYNLDNLFKNVIFYLFYMGNIRSICSIICFFPLVLHISHQFYLIIRKSEIVNWIDILIAIICRKNCGRIQGVVWFVIWLHIRSWTICKTKWVLLKSQTF